MDSEEYELTFNRCEEPSCFAVHILGLMLSMAHQDRPADRSVSVNGKRRRQSKKGGWYRQDSTFSATDARPIGNERQEGDNSLSFYKGPKAELLSHVQLSLRRIIATEGPFQCPSQFDVAIEDIFCRLAEDFVRSGRQCLMACLLALLMIDLELRPALEMSKGMKALVSISVKNTDVCLAILMDAQLRKEHWYLRSQFKKNARSMLLTHYGELSPSKRDLEEWCRDNHALLSANHQELSMRDKMAVYRKEVVGDLTGREGSGEKRRAKFIYDLYNAVSLNANILLVTISS